MLDKLLTNLNNLFFLQLLCHTASTLHLLSVLKTVVKSNVWTQYIYDLKIVKLLCVDDQTLRRSAAMQCETKWKTLKYRLLNGC